MFIYLRSYVPVMSKNKSLFACVDDEYKMQSDNTNN